VICVRVGAPHQIGEHDMSAHAAIGRLYEYTALGIAGVLAPLPVGSGLADVPYPAMPGLP